MPARPLPPQLLESQVTDQIRGFLESRGWRAIRMQRTVVPGAFTTGEPGMADFLFLYPLPDAGAYGVALQLWIELKNPRARMSCKCLVNRGTRRRCTFCDQRNWQRMERVRGFVVWSAVNDFAWFESEYQIHFGWLHSGVRARGQLDLLAGMGA